MSEPTPDQHDTPATGTAEWPESCALAVLLQKPVSEAVLGLIVGEARRAGLVKHFNPFSALAGGVLLPSEEEVELVCPREWSARFEQVAVRRHLTSGRQRE